ncbi:MAG: DegV family protein [Atopobiaceae bacterium]|nr:DegV family protein [Atopobiaceae bacterium]
MNDQRIAVICDSGTDTPPDFVREHDVRVIPLTINYADGSYLAGVDITTNEVIERFAEEIPTTSLPSPTSIKEALDTARADGYTSAVIVTISSGLSSTFQTSQMISRMIEDFPIICVDSKSIGVSAGMVVMNAVEMIEAGIPFDELQEKLDEQARLTDVFFCVNELSYLYKGGRIGKTIYALGTTLNIKPIIYCDPEGYYKMFKKARGWMKALDTIVNTAANYARRYEQVRVAICSTSAADALGILEEKVRVQIPNLVELVKAGIGPDLIVHTGPELVGVALQPLWH